MKKTPRRLALLLGLLACGGPRAPAPVPVPAAASSTTTAEAPSSTTTVTTTVTTAATTSASTPTPPPAAPPHAEESLAVLSPGADPKRALRYAFHADRKERMAMELRMTLFISMDGNARPPVNVPPAKMEIAIEPERVEPSGNLVYRFALDKVDVPRDAKADPRFFAAIEEEMRKLVGLRGEAEVTPRGKTERATIAPPPGASEQMADTIEEVQRSLRDLTVPLPEQPVGRGAKWTSTRPLHMKMMTVSQAVTYTLTQVDGDHGTLDVSIAMSAPPQQIQSGGARVMLDSVQASGKSNVRFDLQRLVPVADSDVTVDVASTIDAGGDKHAMRTSTTIGVRVAPGK